MHPFHLLARYQTILKSGPWFSLATASLLTVVFHHAFNLWAGLTRYGSWDHALMSMTVLAAGILLGCGLPRTSVVRADWRAVRQALLLALVFLLANLAMTCYFGFETSYSSYAVASLCALPVCTALYCLARQDFPKRAFPTGMSRSRAASVEFAGIGRMGSNFGNAGWHATKSAQALAIFVLVYAFAAWWVGPIFSSIPSAALSARSVLAILVFNMLFIGCAEELVFRGVVFGTLEKHWRGRILGFSSANWVSAALYAWVHNFVGDPLRLPWFLYLVPYGLLFGVLRERAGTWLAPAVAHAAIIPFALLVHAGFYMLGLPNVLDGSRTDF